jgi:hypothetical protein
LEKARVREALAVFFGQNEGYYSSSGIFVRLSVI